MIVKPYSNNDGSKKEQVTEMFNRIAPSYDKLNSWLSFRVDKIWRRRVVKMVQNIKYPNVLDVATGTGDLAIAMAKKVRLNTVYGVDISTGMLELAKQKVLKNQLQNKVILKEGDSENLPFDDASFDVVTVAFGVRNFGNLNAGLKEMARVLRPGGKMIVLELSKPSSFPMKDLYRFYFTRILPWWGGLISHDKEAYSYLPASVSKFPEGEFFDAELIKAGMNPLRRMKQTFGIATIYVAEKAMQ
ncbi:MAG TPA: bifunctional demethylmenaquinone methyltransferase/2-methoxy-6-polyprenyl-1,4-benzoquinol methylase UbiE [Marinilabiliaceae bacterium]|nr:bifunctional demethylmenaquinone methyltransferase/2-methoxy-6-polyprenyl-1,4-benzoquinol methylase UbiE [Marinilabiliaceae bacterium]